MSETRDTQDLIENRTLEELSIGESAEMVRVLEQSDIELFAVMSGDVNPAHLDAAYANGTALHHVIAHGMWGGALISAVLGTRLPGPGTIYVDQSLHFRRPVAIGDTITVRVTVAQIDLDSGQVTLDCLCRNQHGKVAIEGQAQVLAPRQKVRCAVTALPMVRMHMPGARFGALVDQARSLPPLATAVVHPCDALSLTGALQAQSAGLIDPYWVGPIARIIATATEAGVTLDPGRIIDAPHSHGAAEAAVALVRAGQVHALMKGKLHTDELLEAVLHRTLGLRTERRLSHVFALDVPDHDRMLFITDAAINIAPDLTTLADIVQNALDLAIALGIETPRAALLSAVETVTAKLPSTLLAAAICKMHDRGQITGGLVDGPLAFDNAISPMAVAAKGIVSEVAGRADILVAPNLESGNMIAKQLIHLARAESAGVALGASVPIILTSRSDSAAARLASCALARLLAAASQKGAV
ncbi:phosphate acetyltransferase/phosphate butyryltransferase [Roseinatronobacter thiooxidans]|uniref:Phosphate acetyltransferase/phosphate butyryltransferase n=1 Tax=Roseinatronobacter thiooxidans TaxID=121821 RepID=A0A2W7Q0F9_9RHOB|nr:bifunctional enoyl-CoA hydratase/phosphate acetyltransferase [Roseinatronobacter thiooxidans]PZX39540.1 phosphate acetyltransferase/phosphate butyryltransferase [Roseinatronobacter thiooxidans]